MKITRFFIMFAIFSFSIAARECPNKGGQMKRIPKGLFFSGASNQLKLLNYSYCIDKYEVSAKDYQNCVKDGACPSHSSWEICQKINYEKSPNQCIKSRGHYPANYISWEGANKFCQWAGKRLLTRDEWEKAARGILPIKYPWGNNIDCERAHFSRGNYFKKCLNYRRRHNFPAPATSYPQSVSYYGIFNMSGNVQEWISYPDTLSNSHRSLFINPISMGGDFTSSAIGTQTTSSKGLIGKNLTTQGHGIRCGSF